MREEAYRTGTSVMSHECCHYLGVAQADVVVSTNIWPALQPVLGAMRLCIRLMQQHKFDPSAAISSNGVILIGLGINDAAMLVLEVFLNIDVCSTMAVAGRTSLQPL